MCTRRWLTEWIVAGLALGLVGVVRAEVTTLTGAAEASVVKYYLGDQGDSDSASDTYPGTSADLPLQVLALLNTPYPDEAAGMAAAQFADPREFDQPNPEEFAINLTLNSISPHIRYTGQAAASETREVLFSESELGQPDGTTTDVLGRVYIDGALAVFSVSSDRDLTGATVSVRITVIKQVEGQDDEVLFNGSAELAGGSGGSIVSTTEGDLPAISLQLSDLSALPDDFGVLHVLILPDLTVTYPYTAVVGEPFTLRAKIEVEAANLEDAVGVAALIGTPADSLTKVIGLTQGQSAAAKLLSAIERERADAADPAATSADVTPGLALPGLCGAMGLNVTALAVLGMLGLKLRGTGRSVRRG